LDDRSAQVFPYNIFAYCSICRVDSKFARNKKKGTTLFLPFLPTSPVRPQLQIGVKMYRFSQNLLIGSKNMWNMDLINLYNPSNIRRGTEYLMV
jgi:hypothetical protein